MTMSDVWTDNTILECDPPRRLVYTWRSLYNPEMATEPESRVTWEIEPQPGGFSKLTLVHDRLEQSPRTAEGVRGWSYVLSNLFANGLHMGGPFSDANAPPFTAVGSP
jgi:uncharacterized protein YndB with AHSA1/START domain